MHNWKPISGELKNLLKQKSNAFALRTGGFAIEFCQVKKRMQEMSKDSKVDTLETLNAINISKKMEF